MFEKVEYRNTLRGQGTTFLSLRVVLEVKKGEEDTFVLHGRFIRNTIVQRQYSRDRLLYHSENSQSALFKGFLTRRF